MKTGAILTAMASGLALVGQPLAAQSVSQFDNYGRVETRAMLGVTIPLGGQRQKADTKPRLDLRFDTSRIDAERSITLNPLLRDRRDTRASVFSLTLEDRPRVMLNGHAFAHIGPTLHADDEADESEDAEKEERSTGEKVLRGAGWVGIGALGVLAVGTGIFLASCGDGDCFVDD